MFIRMRVQDQSTPLNEGLEEAFEWYRLNKDAVIIKPYIEYIDHRRKQQ